MATRETTTVERVSLPLYTFADADRLAHVSRGTSKRWLSGYRYRTAQGQPTGQPPVTPGFGDREAASFTDLVEIVAIGGLKGLGFSLQEIREFVRNCQAFLGVDRPLTKLKFKTDGREFYVDRGQTLLEVGRRKRSQAWNEVLEPFLQSLDYADEVAARWWPLGKSNPIVVDPDYAYGFPVLAGSGVRTEIILERFQARDLDDQIAADFNIDPVDVQRALQYELQRAA